MEVNDLSYSGLSAKPFNNADIVMFKVGMKVLLISPELQMQVVSVSENLIRFKILPSNISEHIKLFNLKTKVGERDLAIKTPIPEDILQLYSVSGSLSSSELITTIIICSGIFLSYSYKKIYISLQKV